MPHVQPKDLYDHACVLFKQGAYEDAVNTLNNLSDTDLPNSTQLDISRKCALAVLYYHKGFWGKALSICQHLPPSIASAEILQVIQMQLAFSNGKYESKDIFLTNFLQIVNGTLTFTNAFLTDDETSCPYEMQFDTSTIFARPALANPGNTLPSFVLRFAHDYSNVYVATIGNHKSGYEGLYYRAKQNKTK